MKIGQNSQMTTKANSKANEILSLSVERENRLKLCQATWTTHSHSEKFNKILKNFANFTRFSLLFSTKKVTGSLVKLSESTSKEFILCFQSYLCSFCTISSGLRVQFRHLLANLRKIYTANSIKVDIDNSQMCNMIDRVPIDMMILYVHTRYYVLYCTIAI